MKNLKDQLAGIAALIAAIIAIGGGFVKYGEITTKLDALEAQEHSTVDTSGIEKEIFSDFLATSIADEVENNYRATFRISAQVKGVGRATLSTGDASGDGDTYEYYKRVILKGSISGITFPSQTLELQLKLQNF